MLVWACGRSGGWMAWVPDAETKGLFAWQGGAVERECIICWAPPTVRFGCGHSFLCGGEDCLGAWLAEHKPCVPALTPRAQKN